VDGPGAAALGSHLLCWRPMAARPLFNPDEGRYGKFRARCKAAGTGSFSHLNGLAYIEIRGPGLHKLCDGGDLWRAGPGEASSQARPLLPRSTALAPSCLAWLVARRLVGSMAAGAPPPCCRQMFLSCHGHAADLDMSPDRST